MHIVFGRVWQWKMSDIMEINLDINPDNIDIEVFSILDAIRPSWKKSETSIEVNGSNISQGMRLI
jgi:hypothetical protein